jgi:Flp pilus assembly protein TadB
LFIRNFFREKGSTIGCERMKLRQLFYYILVAVLLIVFIIFAAQNFYLWVAASVVGFALLLVYERLRSPKRDDSEAKDSQ